MPTIIKRRGSIKKKEPFKNPCSIKEICVEDLFGYYSYKLPNQNLNNDLSKLSILYGDNGSGKTTILKCLFNLISTKDNAGLKTKLANTKFKKFYVRFENGVELGADRKEKIIEGNYRLYIKKDDVLVHDVDLKVNLENSIQLTAASKEKQKFDSILNYIRKLNISIFYLADDRKLFTNDIVEQNEEGHFSSLDVDFVTHRGELRRKRKKRVELELAIERFIEWVRKKVIDDSSTGDNNSLSIYNDLIKNIYASKEEIGGDRTKEYLLSTVEDLSRKSLEFSQFGLINRYEYKEILTTLGRMRNAEKLNLIYKIMNPFFESLQAKLTALESLQTTLLNLTQSLNSYLSNKNLSFNISNGFTVLHEKGGEIDIEDLSSGEKQLLLLLLNTITASEDATIFIIDEPEISLNIKWQRNLLKTLMDFNQQGRVQFVIATHSIELLANNLNQVAKIEE